MRTLLALMTLAALGGCFVTEDADSCPYGTEEVSGTCACLDGYVEGDSGHLCLPADVCTAASSCGGDPTGDYRYERRCPYDQADDTTGCDGVFVRTHEKVYGDFILYDDGTYAIDRVTEYQSDRWRPEACVSSCEGEVADGYCVTNELSGTYQYVESGRWDWGGTTLQLDPEPNDVRTLGEPYSVDYCVTEYGLTLGADGTPMFLGRVR